MEIARFYNRKHSQVKAIKLTAGIFDETLKYVREVIKLGANCSSVRINYLFDGSPCLFLCDSLSINNVCYLGDYLIFEEVSAGTFIKVMTDEQFDLLYEVAIDN
jgi:hypothetical protein